MPRLVIALLLLALVAPAGTAAARRPSHAHGCGVLVVAAFPWRNHIDGTAHELGDHWITDWRGTAGDCAFTRRTLRSLISHTPGFIAELHNPFAFAGGMCVRRQGSGHERITPFGRVRCALPVRIRHRRVGTVVEAFVDPDPRFIR